jgi:hypothetical protein
MVSVAASSHPSHRERESERETSFWSRAGRSQWPRGRTDTTTVVLESQPTAGTMASPPAAVGNDAALLAARQLLNNPPPVRASPSAAKQWCHDVDQLVIAAINTPHREGRCQPFTQQSRFPSAARTPSVAQAPPGVPGARPPVQHRALMASYRTTDLREEINHRRGGEDSHTTIERNRERRRDIEGHNLERDFDLHAPVGACQAAHAPLPPGSPGVWGGAWSWPHTYVWWFGHPSSDPTCQRSMTGWSTQSSSCRSTPPPSSLLGGIRLSWPTTSP